MHKSWLWFAAVLFALPSPATAQLSGHVLMIPDQKSLGPTVDIKLYLFRAPDAGDHHPSAISFELRYDPSVLEPGLPGGAVSVRPSAKLQRWYHKSIQAHSPEPGRMIVIVGGMNPYEISTFDDRIASIPGIEEHDPNAQENPFLLGTIRFNVVGPPHSTSEINVAETQFIDGSAPTPGYVRADSRGGLFSVEENVQEVPPGERGDVNGDGSANAVDAQIVINGALGRSWWSGLFSEEATPASVAPAASPSPKALTGHVLQVPDQAAGGDIVGVKIYLFMAPDALPTHPLALSFTLRFDPSVIQPFTVENGLVFCKPSEQLMKWYGKGMSAWRPSLSNWDPLDLADKTVRVFVAGTACPMTTFDDQMPNLPGIDEHDPNAQQNPFHLGTVYFRRVGAPGSSTALDPSDLCIYRSVYDPFTYVLDGSVQGGTLTITSARDSSGLRYKTDVDDDGRTDAMDVQIVVNAVIGR